MEAIVKGEFVGAYSVITDIYVTTASERVSVLVFGYLYSND